MNGDIIDDKSIRKMYIDILLQYVNAETVENTDFWDESYTQELRSKCVDEKFIFKIEKAFFYYIINIVPLDRSSGFSNFIVYAHFYDFGIYRKISKLFKMNKNKDKMIENSKKQKALMDILPLTYKRKFKIESLE